MVDYAQVSTFQGGCFFGAIFGYPMGVLLGRKTGLLIAALLFVLGSGIMLAADGARGLGPIYGGRIVAGLGIGAASNLTPLYISEIAPPAIRGQLIGMYEIGKSETALRQRHRVGVADPLARQSQAGRLAGSSASG